MQTMNVSVADGIALLSIGRPAGSLDEFMQALRTELAAAVERIVADPQIIGAILVSSEPGQFLAGGDVPQNGGISAMEARDLSRGWQMLTRRIELSGKPFVAAIDGLALDTGFELALCCHYRVLADRSAGGVGLTQVKRGLMPAAGGTQRLARMIGVAQAMPLLMDGKQLAPTEALRLGIVDYLAPAAQVIAKAREWLRAQPQPVQPWDKKGFVVPGGAGPLANGAQQTFMVGVAQLRKKKSAHSSARLAILSAVYEGTITAFDTGLVIEAKYVGWLASSPNLRDEAACA